MPHKKTHNIPYELWKGHKPNYKYLKVWGCLTKVAIPKPKRTKLGPKTIDCVFIGYAHNSSAYRFLVHKSEVPDIDANTIIESRDAIFFENIFPYKMNNESVSLKRLRESIGDGNKEVNSDEPR